MAVDGNAVKMWSRSDGSFDSPDLLKHTARFRDGYSIVHDPGTSMGEILSANGLPKIGEPYENNSWIFCKRLVPKRGLVYTTVDAEYEGEVGPGGKPDGSPLDDLPEYEFSSVASTEPMDEDASNGMAGPGRPIVTACGETIEGVTKEIYDVLLTVDRNFLDINIPVTKEYLESVNSDPWPPIKPFPPGTGRLRNFRAKPVLQPNGAIKYWNVHAEILFRTPYNTTNDRAWWARVRHEGYRVRTVVGACVNAWEDLQMNVNKPVLLDVNGFKLPEDEEAVWLEFQKYPNQRPYSALGLF